MHYLLIFMPGHSQICRDSFWCTHSVSLQDNT